MAKPPAEDGPPKGGPPPAAPLPPHPERGETSSSYLLRTGLLSEDAEAAAVFRRLIAAGSVDASDLRGAILAAAAAAPGEEGVRENEDGDGRPSKEPEGPEKESPDGTGAAAAATTTTTTTAEEAHPPPPLPARRTRHVALRLLYDGRPHTGFAQNVGRSDDASVERAFFEALRKTDLLVGTRESCGYSRCGRTDRGVSSNGQVVALRLKSAVPPGAVRAGGGGGGGGDEEGGTEVSEEDLPKNCSERLELLVPRRRKGERGDKKKKKKKKGKRRRGTEGEEEEEPHEARRPSSAGAPTETVDGDGDDGGPSSDLLPRSVTELSYPRLLNNVLPPSVRVLGWAPVTLEFSARFSASDRTYRYYFVRRKLDLAKMEEGLNLLVGRHDFRNFCKMDVEKVYNFERVVRSAKIVAPEREEGGGRDDGFRDVCRFEIVGQAFLWHQIRCVVAILFLVGERLEKPSVVTELLDVGSNPGKPSYAMAPDFPLVLHGCGYGGNLTFGYDASNLWSVHCNLEREWEDLALGAERVRDAMESLGDDARVTVGDVRSFVSRKRGERAKRERRRNGGSRDVPPADEAIPSSRSDEDVVTWGEALDFIESSLGTRPGPSGPREVAHVPLMKRSRGTTYEEKVAAILNDEKSRRRDKYEENILKKRKTSEEDEEFYRRMLKQGGTGM